MSNIEEAKIKIKNLKQGDILLFSYIEEDTLSKLIALITKSEVSHSAMSYYDYSEIVEETPPCARVAQIKDRIKYDGKDRTITIMRLDSANDDMTKVLDIAKGYVENEEPYTYVNLIFIVIYMLIEKVTINLKLQELICSLMKHAISDLMNYINSIVHKGTHPMICSQFVYNCYENAGDEYKLIISKDNETIQCNSEKSLLARVQDYISKNKENIEDKLANHIDKIKIDDTYSMIDKDALIEEIYHELKNNDVVSVGATSDLHEEFVIATHEFCAVLNHFYRKDKEELLIKGRYGLQSKPVNALRDVEEYFVTPEDLLSNCKNLINVGVLDNESND